MIARSADRERVLYEFDGFRVDPVRRVLLRDGEPVAITPKALSILLVLLEKPGEVVEKAELIERIWPGVFVTEANLTQNIFSLRKSLGERANDNRYIVTVPGRGYSFAAELRRTERFPTTEMQIPAELLPPQAPPPVPGPATSGEIPIVMQAPPAPLSDTASSPAVPVVSAPPATPAEPPRRASVWRRGLQAAVVTSLLVALVATGVHVFSHLGDSPGKLDVLSVASGATVRPAIAVLDFRNLSPSADTLWLETAFAEMLTTELGASGKLRVVRGETVAEAMRSMDFRDPSTLSHEELARLHDAIGANLLVVGSYLPMKEKIRLDLRVLKIPDGEMVTSMAEVGTQAGLFDLVSRTGSRLRESLGVTATSPEQVQQARALRPANTEASRLYSEGLARMRDFDPPGALPLLEQAAKADPNSAAIRSALSRNWSDLGFDQRAAQEAQQAVRLAGSLSREERLLAEARLHKASRRWEKASEAYRSLWTFFPDDIDYGLQLADTLTLGGQCKDAKVILDEIRKLPLPSGADPRIDIAEAKNARRLSDFQAQKRAAEAAIAKGRRSGQGLIVSQALIYQGDALVVLGRPREAIPLFRESEELARRAGFQWLVGMSLANLGGGLQAMGDLDGAERANNEALEIALRLGTGMGTAAQYQILGSLHLDRGELGEALKLFEQSRQWFVRIGDRLSEIRVINAIGVVLRLQGNLAGAQSRFEDALKLSQALGNAAEQAVALDNLGALLESRGELAEARRRHEEAFKILHQAGGTSPTALALMGIASTAARTGDLHTAWQRAAQALAIYRQAGDRIGVGRVLGLRSRLAYEMGNLTESRAAARDQLQISRDTGARSLAAQALQNLGRADFAAGDVAAARGALDEALQISSSLGEEPQAMEIRLDLAHLALVSSQPSEAARLAEAALTWCGARGLASCELDARSSLAEALLAQGRTRESLAVVAQTRLLAETSQDRTLRVRAQIRLANVEAALGDPKTALLQLRHTVDDAAGLGLTTAGLGARLALGELQRKLGDPDASATLSAVGRDASARGFKAIAEIAIRGPRTSRG